MISIESIEEFTRIMDEGIDTTELEKLEFLRRIPLGIYCFSILESSEIQDDPVNKNYEVLLDNDTEQAYDDFTNDLEYILKTVSIGEREILTKQELETLFDSVKRRYFTDYKTLIGYRDENVKNILRYYAQTEDKPDFLAFKDCKKCDIAEVSRYICDNDLGVKARTEYENSLWEEDKTFWQVLFSYDKSYFDRQLDIEIRKITSPRHERTIEPVSIN